MSTELLRSIQQVIGLTVLGIRRVFYELRGEMNQTVGALELNLSEGRTLLLDAGPDGESLKLQEQAWEDPFAEERLTPENRAFIARSGKWTAVDVSDDPAYRPVLGGLILQANPILAETNKVVGLVLRTNCGDLRAEVEADDLYVQIG